ncbi:MAG: glycosyl transferase, group 1 [Flaviaesturariibacter sp.]|nr:glycosyl transferase, group 1 [Flaviaesturariibacter sp.]
MHLVKEAAARGHIGTVALPANGALVELLRPFSGSFQIVILRSRLWMGRRYTLPVGLVRFAQALCDLPGYLRLLKEEKFDAVVINSSVAPVPLIAAHLSGVPSLLMVRESLMTNPMLKSAFPKAVIRRLLSIWATDVVAISEYVAGQIRSASTIIYPQVSQEFLDFQPELRHDRFDQGLKAVMFGTVSPEKGQLDAIQAVRIARDRGTPVSLKLYGHGSDSDLSALRATIAKLGLQDSVALKNSTSEVLQAYQPADISIVCSKNEAFGKVTAESVLAGRPVVAYGCGGTSEILLHGGGICTDPNPTALAEALSSIYDNEDLMHKLKKEAVLSPIRGKLASSAGEVLNRVELLFTYKTSVRAP